MRLHQMDNRGTVMEDDLETWEGFYSANAPPPKIDHVKKILQEFCLRHTEEGRNVVFITSGGTTVPLEHNTVRFVDNFSAGTRGAASAEYFLAQGYGVIFLHREKSLEPFTRSLPWSGMLDAVRTVQDGDQVKIEVVPEMVSKILPILQRYKAVKDSNMLLKITFITLADYLHLLRVAAEVVRQLKHKALLYLAAAVSDFYIPQDNMSTHKIQSSSPLELHLHLVPKMIKPLVHYWVPEAYVVSFKLETDESILLQKARQALEKYGHKMVIANELHTRKQQVVLVTKDDQQKIRLTAEEMNSGVEIEEKIIAEVVTRHKAFCEGN